MIDDPSPGTLRAVLERAVEKAPAADGERFSAVVAEVARLLPDLIDSPPADAKTVKERYRRALKDADACKPATVRNRIYRLRILLRNADAAGWLPKGRGDAGFPVFEVPASAPDRRRHVAYKEFAAWCAEGGINYADVDPGTVSSYRDHLLAKLSPLTAETSFGDLKRWWAEHGAAGRLAPLYFPPFGKPKRTFYGLARDRWPQAWQDDFARFRRAAEGRPEGDEEVWGTRLSPSRIGIHERELRQFLGYLALRGFDPASESPRRWLCDAALVTGYVEWHVAARCGGAERTYHPENLRLFARLVRHLYGAAETAQALERAAASMRGTAATDRFEGLETEYRAIVDGACRALRDANARWAASPPGPGRAGAARFFRDALCFALLVLRPLRASNIAGLRLGGNLRKDGGEWRLHFDGPEMKNGKPYDGPFPPRLAADLELYVDEVLLALPCGNSGQLFPSRLRGIMRITDLSRRVKLMVPRYLDVGSSISTHDFRGMVATAYLADHPGEFQAVQQVLGHRYLETTLRSYVRVRGVAASRRTATFLRETCPHFASVAEWAPAPHFPF